MKHYIHVIGGATWDALFTTKEAKLWRSDGNQKYMAFPYGGKVDASDILYTFGGGAANVAVSLSSLGVNTSIVTRVGDDWRGREVIKNLKKQGINTNGVQLDKNHPTALAFIVTAGNAHDHVAFIERGATEYLQIPTELPVNTTWIYVTALATSDWYVKLRTLFASAKSKGQNIFWNPGGQQLVQPKKLISLLKYVTVLDMNKEEAKLLLKSKIKNQNVKLLSNLHKLGSKSILVTDGANGAYYYDGKNFWHEKSHKVKPINTTGAGDAFGSGFLAGYLHSNNDIAKAMQWGMCNSTSVILQAGAQKGILSVKTLLSFIKQYH